MNDDAEAAIYILEMFALAALIVGLIRLNVWYWFEKGSSEERRRTERDMWQ